MIYKCIKYETFSQNKKHTEKQTNKKRHAHKQADSISLRFKFNGRYPLRLNTSIAHPLSIHFILEEMIRLR